MTIIEKIGFKRKKGRIETSYTDYEVYTITTAGVLNWQNVAYYAAADLNETVFNQDITGDSKISSGSTTSSLSDRVSSTNIDQEVQQEFGNIAQSDIVAISNADSSSSDAIEMFVNGTTSVRTMYEL